ncbi:MAG: Ig-like domain-containing protein [Elusimicrobiota bacterium]
MAHISTDSGDGRQLFGYQTSSAPVIDGNIATWPGEWADAYVRNIYIASEIGADSSYYSQMLIKHDTSYLYVAFVTDSAGDNSVNRYVHLFFDQGSSSNYTVHDDSLTAQSSGVGEFSIRCYPPGRSPDYYVYIWNGSAWTIDLRGDGSAETSAGTGLKCYTYEQGGGIFNYEFRIPLSTGTTKSYLKLDTTSEVGLYPMAGKTDNNNTPGDPGINENYWAILNDTKNNAAISPGWADLQLGINAPDRLVSALYSNTNNPTVTDGNIATDAGWEGAFEKEFVLTNFGVSGSGLQTYNATLHLKDDGTSPDYLYFGIEITGAAGGDQLDLYFDYDVGASDPANQDYELTNNGENAVRVKNSAFTDYSFNTGVWTTADANNDTAGDDGTSGSIYGFEFKVPKKGTQSPGDLQIGRNGKTGFLMKFTKGGQEYWWNRFANTTYCLRSSGNYSATGWCTLQSGGAYVVSILPAQNAAIGDGAYPVLAEIIPFPTYSITSVLWRLEDVNTEEGVAPYDTFSSSLTKSGDTNYWAGSINTSNVSNSNNYRITIQVTDQNNNVIKKYIPVSVTNISETTLTPPAITINTPIAGSTLKGQYQISFTVTPVNTGATVPSNSSAFSIDGGSYTPVSTQPTAGSGAKNGYEVLYTTNYADGTHIIKVKAIDSNGTTGYSDVRTIVVDNTVPSVIPAGYNNYGVIYSSTVQARTIAKNGDTITLAMQTSDSTSLISTTAVICTSLGIATPLTLSDSGVQGDIIAGDGIYSSSVTIVLATPLCGWATVYFYSTDLIGNTAGPIAGRVYIDSVPPEIVILSPINSTVYASAGKGIDVSFVSNDTNLGNTLIKITDSSGTVFGSTEYSATGTTFTVLNATIHISSSTPEGLKSVRIESMDTAGNSFVTISTNVIMIDNTIPNIYNPSPPSGAIVSTSTVLINAAFTDPVGTLAVTPAGIDTASCVFIIDAATVPAVNVSTGTSVILENMANGLHTVTLNIRDRAGNSAGSFSWFFIVDTQSPQTAAITRISPAFNINGSSCVYVKGTINITAVAADNIYVSSMTLFADNIPVNTVYTPPYDFTYTPSEGSHSLYIIAYDSSTNSMQSSAYSIICDTTPPWNVQFSAPGSNSYVSGITTFKYSATDNYGIARVLLAVNTTDIAGMAFNSAAYVNEIAVDTTKIPDGTSTAQIVAYDYVGSSAASSILNFVVDNTAPQTSLLVLQSPASGQMVIQYSANDAVSQITKSELWFNNKLVSTSSIVSEIAINTYIVNTAQFSDGSYIIRTVVYDSAGNRTESDGRFVTIDNTNPLPPVTCRISPAYMVEGSTLSFIKGTVNIQAVAQDNILLSHVTFYLSTGLALYTDSTRDNGWSVSWNTALYPDGHYTLYCVAVDSMTNKSESMRVSVIVDNTAPVLTINPYTTPTKYPNQLISGTYAEKNVVALYVNGMVVSPVLISTCTWAYPYSLVNGTNVVTVNIIDGANNTFTATQTTAVQTSIYLDPRAPIGFIYPRKYEVVSSTCTIEPYIPSTATDIELDVSTLTYAAEWYSLDGIVSTYTTVNISPGATVKVDWNTLLDQLSDGTSYYLRIKAYNREQPAAYPGWMLASDVIGPFTVDNTAPYITAISTTPGTYGNINTPTYYPPIKTLTDGTKEAYATKLCIKLNVNDPVSGPQHVVVKVESYDSTAGVFVKSYYSELPISPDDNVAVCYIDLVEGANKLSLVPVDRAGNKGMEIVDTIVYKTPKAVGIATKNAETVISSPDGTSVTVVAGAVLNDTIVTIVPVSRTLLAKPSNPGVILTPVAREFSPQGTVFAKPVTISLPFTETDLDNNRDGVIDTGTEFDIAKLAIVFWDGNEWIKTPENVVIWDSGTRTGYVTAKVNHFSIYAIAQVKTEIPTALSVYLTKNPFNISGHTTFVYSLPKPGTVELRILDLAGDNVISILENTQNSVGENSCNWDGNNEFGHYVGSGVYFYILKYQPEDGSAPEFIKGTVGVIK